MIVWESEMQKALARGAAEHKPILLEFYSAECISCKQMDTVTFQNNDVANYILEKMVPLRVPVSNNPLASEFRVAWTPTFVILDYYGKEYQRTVGFIPADEMVAQLILGIGKTGFANDQFNEAVLQFSTLLNGYPQSACAPEAVYWRAVARYKSSHSPAALKECYSQLSTQYPGSEWTRRAEPFALL